MLCNRCKSDVDLGAHTEEECRQLSWEQMCPPQYRQTDPKRLRSQQLETVLKWEYGPKGLLLLGPTGSGKTRTAYEFLRRWHMEGKRVKAFSCADFGHECAAAFSDAENGLEWFETMVRRPIVFFDDIDKMKLTERVETELFGLIEKRISHCLPVIVTTQLQGQQLAGKFSDSARGEAIVRRLREFCEVVKF